MSERSEGDDSSDYDNAQSIAGTLAHALIRWRWLALAAWVAICAVFVPAAARLDARIVPPGRVPDSESARVEKLLAERFHSPFARYAILVIRGLPVRGSPEGVEVLTGIVRTVASLPAVTGVTSVISTPDTLLLGNGGKDATVVVGIASTANAGPMIRALRDSTREMAATLRAKYPGSSMRWTGEDALNLDLRQASSDDVRRAEVRALPVTAVLLVVVFGGIVAALLPIGMGMMAIPVTLGAGAFVALHRPVSLLFGNVVSLLGLALGIDYALLMVSRFRDERETGSSVKLAAASATQSAGHTIIVSGAAVAIGFAPLVTVPLGELNSIGIGGLFVSVVAVLLATTLLPAMLVWIGGRLPARVGASERRHNRARVRWLRWSAFVTSHPIRVALAAAVPLVTLAMQLPRMKPVLPSGDWLPASAESAEAFRDLERMGRGNVLQNVRVMLQFPPGLTAWDSTGWDAIWKITEAIESDPRIGRIRSLPSLAGGRPPQLVRALLPDSSRRSFVSDNSRLVLLNVVPTQRTTPHDAIRLVRQLRTLDASAITGVPGATMLIGGLPAFNADYEDAVGSYLRRVIGLVLGGTFIALLIGFRSVLVPLKAIAMNLLTVAAACGAVVVAFQDGALARMFGLSGPLDAVFPTLPLLVFCTVFGISMDYEVFLIASVRDSRRRGQDDRAAIAEGLARTGGVITSAATIMIVIFGAFALGDFLPTQLLGFALAVAVLADATLVRLAIGPALLTLAGRWNWWPGDRTEPARVRGQGD